MYREKPETVITCPRCKSESASFFFRDGDEILACSDCAERVSYDTLAVELEEQSDNWFYDLLDDLTEEMKESEVGSVYVR